MTWSTHWTIGLNSLWLFSPILHCMLQGEPGLVVVGAALGSLLPDRGASESKIKHLQIEGIKPFFLPAQMIHRTDTHRGMLHSAIGIGFIAALSSPIVNAIGWLPWIALLLGYASHLLADSATKAGIRLWYPSQCRSYLLPKGWRVTTASQAENVIFVTAAVFTLIQLLQFL